LVVGYEEVVVENEGSALVLGGKKRRSA